VYLLHNGYIGYVSDRVHSNNIFHFFSQRFMAPTAGRSDMVFKIQYVDPTSRITVGQRSKQMYKINIKGDCSKWSRTLLTLNVPNLARQRCLPSWGPRRTPWFFL